MTLYPEDIERYDRPTHEPTEADRDAAIDNAVEAADGEMAEGRANFAEWRSLFLAELAEQGYEVRALVGGQPAPTPTRDARQLLDKAAAHLAYLTREPDSWWDDEHCLDNGQSAVIIDHLAVALRAALLGQPATTDVRNTVYDPESDRWCCTVCDQWSDEGAGAATIDHLDHGQPAPTPTREQVDAHGFTDAEHDRDVMAEPLVFTYTNHRGETAERHVSPHRLEWGATEWHPETQWLLWAYDIDRNAERAFSLRALVGGRSAPNGLARLVTYDAIEGPDYSVVPSVVIPHPTGTRVRVTLDDSVGGRSAAPTRDEVATAAQAVLDALTASDPAIGEQLDQRCDRLRALLSRSAAPTTLDGRDDRAHAIIARFFASELAGKPTEPNDTHRGVASDLLSELRAAGLVYDGVVAEPNEGHGDGR